MLKQPTDDLETPRAEGSSPSISSTAVMSALITQTTETRALCAHVASYVVSRAGSTCSARAAIAAAFDDLSVLEADAVEELLRGRSC
ncbi:MAG TPA: hypothetical protein VK427_16675 [Kofleriaceae bacterium]|nr:hypothetical protein [Kofleriaceae bacterium]